MPIKKYASFQEASKDLWVLNPNVEYYITLKNHFAFWSKLMKKKHKSGIQKFKNYNEFLEYKSEFIDCPVD